MNKYYAKEGKAHSAADGAGSGIIGLLEVCEADFSKNLAQVISDEDVAVSEYEQVSKDNEISRTNKVQDVKFKVKESKYLDKFVGELTADRSGVQAELDAVLEYLSKIESECIEKAETYATRKARFDSEIAGLKTALNVLESKPPSFRREAAMHCGEAVNKQVRANGGDLVEAGDRAAPPQQRAASRRQEGRRGCGCHRRGVRGG